MEVLYKSCAGVDVHSELLVVTLYRGRKKEIREFGTTTREILKICDWLSQEECEMVAMESTGSYWKPLYNLLEASGINAMVVNANHMKNVPGKKTDIKDSEWIGDLLRHGLLNPSFIPPRPMREMRELVLHRRKYGQMMASEQNRYLKTLEGANIKLGECVSNIMGQSAQHLLKKALTGEVITAEAIEEMIDKRVISSRMKATPQQLADALEGDFSKDQIFMLEMIKRHMDYLDSQIAMLDSYIEQSLVSEEELWAINALCEIPGISRNSAECIIAAIGTKLDRFPTAGQLCAWAGLCPGNHESARKSKSGKTRKGNQLLRTTLVISAHTAVKVKDSFFHAQFNRIARRRGRKKAYVAVAHSMLIAIYHVLKGKVPYKDLGSDHYMTEDNKENQMKALTKQLERLGFVVTVAPITGKKNEETAPEEPPTSAGSA